MTEIKSWLIGEFQRLGHRHESMTDAIKCSKCGDNFKRVERIYNDRVKKNPELVKRPEPKRVMSQKGQDLYAQLEYRLKNDPMYKEHLKKSSFGTFSERKREAERANSGFYVKNNDLQFKKWR